MESFPLGFQLASFSLAGRLQTNCCVNDCTQLLCPKINTLPDSAATPPSFIPDKGKSGGSWPGRYANTARVRGRRNSKPVFRITFSLSSRQIRRPLSPLEGHLYSSFWRGRGREGEKMHGPLLGSRAFVIVHFERVHESLLTNGPPSQRVASSSFG